MASHSQTGESLSTPVGCLPASAAPTGLRVLLVLSILLAFASISTDLYLPALPNMAAALQADAGVANTIVGALACTPDRAGAVSALVGACQYGCGMLESALVGAFADGSPWPMGCVFAVSGLGSAICAWLVPSAPVTVRT